MTDPEGFILIGGASSRMGRDKAQLTIAGEKFFERSAAALHIVCAGRISLIGNVPSDFESDLPIIGDIRIDVNKNIRAPLIGVYTALMSARSSWIAILACDLPFVTSDLMTEIWGRCSDEVDAVVPLQQDGRPQPLCAFYRREKCLPAAREMLETGDLKLQRFLETLTTRYMDFDEITELDGSAHFFLNVNNPEDHKAAFEISRKALKASPA